MSSKKCHKNR